MFQIEVPMFSLILVTIGQKLKTSQQLYEIQDGGGRHLELWLLKFVNVTGNYIPNKFEDDWLISNEVATVFRNPRWRQPPSWKVHFQLNRLHENWIPCL